MTKHLRKLCFMNLLLVSNSLFAAQTICNNNGGAGWPIADFDDQTINIDYTFADAGITTDVNLQIDISHTWVGDLSAYITSPAGTNVTLFERLGTNAAPNEDTVATGGNHGCSGNNLDVTFDDTAATTLEAATCSNGTPAYPVGSYLVQNTPTQSMADFNDEDPTGLWGFRFIDAVQFDTGALNEACLTVSSAAVIFDQWVSTNATCNDTVSAVNVPSGTNLYVCYILSNPGDESFTLSAGDWSDSLGNDLSPLEGTYNAGASQTLNLGPFIAANPPFPIGTTNGSSSVTIRGNSTNFPSTANITTGEAITVSVSNTPPGSANKPLYLYNNLSLSRINPTTVQAELNLNEGASQTWTLTPALQSNLSINTTGGSIPLSLYLREVGPGNQRTATYTVSGSTSGVIATGQQLLALTGASTLYNINIPITGATNLVSGETITLTITNDTTGSGNRRIRVIPSNGVNNHSLVSLPSNTIINIDSITVHDTAFPANSPITSAQAGDTVFIRSVISDPFGSFDITSASHTITDPSPSVQVNNVTMGTEVADSGTNTKTYEVAYTIPAFPVLGDWRIDILGNEGNEGITHTDFINFLILAPPSLSVVKSASSTSANPGAIITYNITVTNTGTGFAENITLNDSLSPYTDINTGSFSCAAGCPASGITLGTVNFSNDPSGDISAWGVVMSGTMNGNGAAPNNSFTLQYTATVE